MEGLDNHCIGAKTYPNSGNICNIKTTTDSLNNNDSTFNDNKPANSYAINKSSCVDTCSNFVSTNNIYINKINSFSNSNKINPNNIDTTNSNNNNDATNCKNDNVLSNNATLINNQQIVKYDDKTINNVGFEPSNPLEQRISSMNPSSQLMDSRRYQQFLDYQVRLRRQVAFHTGYHLMSTLQHRSQYSNHMHPYSRYQNFQSRPPPTFANIPLPTDVKSWLALFYAKNNPYSTHLDRVGLGPHGPISFHCPPEEPKPTHSYIGIIAMAILNSKEKKLVLSDIYQWILDNYPYFRRRGPGWRNSIRHNLSLNDCFVKSGRSANGKGHYWAVHPANVEDFQKGDFRRRRAQRKVRRAMGLSVPDEDDSPSPSPTPGRGYPNSHHHHHHHPFHQQQHQHQHHHPHQHQHHHQEFFSNFCRRNWIDTVKKSSEHRSDVEDDDEDEGEHDDTDDNKQRVDIKRPAITDHPTSAVIDEECTDSLNIPNIEPSQTTSQKTNLETNNKKKRLFDMESLLAPDSTKESIHKKLIPLPFKNWCISNNNDNVDDVNDNTSHSISKAPKDSKFKNKETALVETYQTLPHKSIKTDASIVLRTNHEPSSLKVKMNNSHSKSSKNVNNEKKIADNIDSTCTKHKGFQSNNFSTDINESNNNSSNVDDNDEDNYQKCNNTDDKRKVVVPLNNGNFRDIS